MAKPKQLQPIIRQKNRDPDFWAGVVFTVSVVGMLVFFTGQTVFDKYKYNHDPAFKAVADARKSCNDKGDRYEFNEYTKNCNYLSDEDYYSSQNQGDYGNGAGDATGSGR